jgi:prolyl 4-hydroxylase
MAPKPTTQPAFRWRTIIEVSAIAVVIYAFLGAPGLNTSFLSSKSSTSIKPPTARAKIESLVYPDKNLSCEGREHGYEVHIFSTRPLVMYIDGFLSDEEADELVELRYVSTVHYYPSPIFALAFVHRVTQSKC